MEVDCCEVGRFKPGDQLQQPQQRPHQTLQVSAIGNRRDQFVENRIHARVAFYSAALIHILKPHDVVLTQIRPRLHFDHMQVYLAGVFQAVDGA